MWRIASSVIPTRTAVSTRSRHQPWQERGLKSLAMSVYFKHPDLGMEKYEVLIRSSAFLLAVDPPDPEPTGERTTGSYSRLLEEVERKRQAKLYRRENRYTPAGGPKRHVKELGWLEFCPREYRPMVHVFTSRHVLAPWKYYPNYYKADFLQIVRSEHCIYFVEVYDTEKPGEPALAKFDLNPYPVLHPAGLDFGLIHLKNEDSALKQLKELGIDILHLRDDENELLQGEELITDGYELQEPPDLDVTVEDTRYFVHLSEPGTISMFADYRYFLKTSRPLPEGACGGPAVDKDGRVAGMVEAVVSPNQSEEGNMELIDQAAMIPPHIIAQFVEWSERQMLHQIVPKDMFAKVVEVKAGREFDVNAKEEPDIDVQYDKLVQEFRKKLPPEKMDALLATIQRDKSEIIHILETEGGDLDEVMARVREKSMNVYASVIEELAEKSQEEFENAEDAAKDESENENNPSSNEEAEPKEAEFEEKTVPSPPPPQ